MREIKFRAWDKKRKKIWYPEDMQHGKMVDPDNCGSLIYCDIEQLALGADGTIYILDECGNFENAVAIGENYELMQFTGLKDSKGKEIYEGDIVRFYEQGYDPNEPDEERIEPETTTVLIYWNENGKCLAIDWGYEDGRIAPVGWGYVYIRNSLFNYHEVIGNIYENPELLKEVSNA